VPQPATLAVEVLPDIQSIAHDGFLIFVNGAGKSLANQSLNSFDLSRGMLVQHFRKFSEKTFNISNSYAGIRRQK
jgi:hypothetical protein